MYNAPGYGDPCILGVTQAVRDAANAAEDGVFTSQDVHSLLVERRAYDPDDWWESYIAPKRVHVEMTRACDRGQIERIGWGIYKRVPSDV